VAPGRDAALAESQREVRALQQDKAAAAKAHKALEAQVGRASNIRLGREVWNEVRDGRHGARLARESAL
jgi:hypothetical protein